MKKVDLEGTLYIIIIFNIQKFFTN